VNYELEKLWEEELIASCGDLSRNLPGEIEENHEKRPQGQ